MKQILFFLVSVGLILGGCGRSVGEQSPTQDVQLQFVRNLSFDMQIPGSYQVRRATGTDFLMHYIIPKEETDLSARWLIYKGYFPKEFPQQTKESVGTIGSLPVTWKHWTQKKDGKTLHNWGALLSEKDIRLPEDVGKARPDVLFQFWIWGTDAEKLTQLKELCSQIKFVYYTEKP